MFAVHAGSILGRELLAELYSSAVSASVRARGRTSAARVCNLTASLPSHPSVALILALLPHPVSLLCILHPYPVSHHLTQSPTSSPPCSFLNRSLISPPSLSFPPCLLNPASHHLTMSTSHYLPLIPPPPILASPHPISHLSLPPPS